MLAVSPESDCSEAGPPLREDSEVNDTPSGANCTCAGLPQKDHSGATLAGREPGPPVSPRAGPDSAWVAAEGKDSLLGLG